jgi:alpha-glucosidase
VVSKQHAREWWRAAVFYEIYPRSFQDSTGDGIGDLRGINARLDHLAWLGIDAIWIAPFYRSPMRDYGYDISDHTDVDPAFGVLADADELLAAARARGIRVIVDYVPNHTSDQHPWFIESRSARTSAKRDWYVWSDPRRDGSPPNNWRSAFPRVGRAWTFDRATEQYYLHHFLPEQPDLNWWNPAVRVAMEEVLRFWLDRGVDGFRIDVAHGLIHDPKLRGNRFRWLRRSSRYANTWDWDRPEVHEVHRGFRTVLDAYRDRVAVGEVDMPLSRLARYYGGGEDELHLALNLPFNKLPYRAAAFAGAVRELERVLPPGAWPNYGLSNHDRSRHATRFAGGSAELGQSRSRAAALMLLTLRGTPFLYYGEELGMTDVPEANAVGGDVDLRDACRTPMQWDATRNAGFTTGRPWLPLARDAVTRNVAAQRDDPASMLSLYRSLIAVRRKTPALLHGDYRPLRAPPDVFAYERATGEERMVVAINFGTRRRRVALGRAEAAGELVISTDHTRAGGRLRLADLTLAANEGVLVRIP